MEIEKIIEGVEIPEDTKKVLVGKLKDIDSSYSMKLAEADSKLKEAIETRDKAKAKNKELQEKITSGDFEGKRELESLKKELETEKAKLEDLNKDLLDKFTKTTQERDKIVNDTKAALIEQIPEGGLREITKEMNLAQLTSYIDGLKKNNIVVDKSLNTKPAKKEVNFPKSFRDWEKTYLEGK